MASKKKHSSSKKKTTTSTSKPPVQTGSNAKPAPVQRPWGWLLLLSLGLAVLTYWTYSGA